MSLSVSSVGPYRLHERAGPSQWRGSGGEGAAVRVSLVDGPAAEAARARRGFAHARLLPLLQIEAAPAGQLAAAGAVEGAFVVTAEPGGLSLREAVTRGGPLAPAAAASLALLLAEPLRALNERGLEHGGVAPDGVFLPAAGRTEPALGVAGFDPEAGRAYRPPEAGGPGALDRWGLVGSLWFALRGAPPGPSGGRHAPPGGRRGGRGPGRGGREALEAIVRRGLSPREGDRYPDWVTLMIDLGAWLERYGAAPPAAPRRGVGRLRAPSPPSPPSLPALDAHARRTLSNEWLAPDEPSSPPFGAPPPARTTPGPWASSAEGPASGSPGPGASPPEATARRGWRALAAAALVGAGVLGGGGAVWWWQGATAPRAGASAAAAPAAASAEGLAEGEPSWPEAGAAAAGGRLVAPLHDESPEALRRCFSAGFAPNAFAPGHDFRPLCAEPDAASGARLLQRALGAGGGGARGGSAAAREWAHYGWYELAVVASLRDRCCGDFPPTRLPPTPPPCGSLHEALERVGVASNAASEPGLDLAIDDFHLRSDCVAHEGYGSLYGRAKGVQRWEETNFRVFVRRFRRAAGAGRGSMP